MRGDEKKNCYYEFRIQEQYYHSIKSDTRFLTFQVFSRISFPLAPEYRTGYPIGVISNLTKIRTKIRGDIHNLVFIAGVNDTKDIYYYPR
jgi:hypothetical protein